MTTKKTLLYFIIFFVFALPLYIFTIALPVSKFESFLKTVPSYIKNIYPPDLTVKVSKGNITINKLSPYCLIMDKTTRIGVVYDEFATPTNLNQSFNNEYSTLCRPIAIVGKTFVIYPDSENEGAYKVQNVPTDIETTITQQVVNSIINTYLPKFTNIAKNIYYIGPFILAIFIALYYLLANLWYALIAMFAFKLIKIDPATNFKSMYPKSFFALFIWTVFQFLFFTIIISGFLKFDFELSFPFLDTIMVTIITILLEKYYFQKHLQLVAVKAPSKVKK